MQEATLIDPDPHSRVLQGFARDIDGQLLRHGTRVLCNVALAPSEFKRDTPENRAAFSRLGFAWTPSVRRALFFAEETQFPRTLLCELNTAATACAAFFAAIEQNLAAAANAMGPNGPGSRSNRHPLSIDSSPFLTGNNASRLHKVADLTIPVLGHVACQWGVPEGLDWPSPQVDRWTMRTNQVRVYQCDSAAGTNVRVVAAFVTALQFVADEPPRPRPLDASLAFAIARVYGKWAQEQRAIPAMAYLTLASADSAMSISDALSPWTADSVCSNVFRSCIVSHCDSAGEWHATPTSTAAGRSEHADWCDCLVPRTWRERLSRIKREVDEQLATARGHVVEDQIARHCGESSGVVSSALIQLQACDPRAYHLYRHEDQLAVRAPRPGEKPEIDGRQPYRLRASIARRVIAWAMVVIGIVALRLPNHLRLPSLASAMLMCVLACIVNELQMRVQRQLESNNSN